MHEPNEPTKDHTILRAEEKKAAQRHRLVESLIWGDIFTLFIHLIVYCQ